MEPGAVMGWAQSYFEFGDFVNARKWYTRRLELGGSEEEIYCAMHRLAVSMHKLGEWWPDVQDAYLRAWAFRPSRAESLHAVASRYRGEGRYQLGYLFSRRAAGIPHPDRDQLCVDDDVYRWRALDELAVCAAWIGEHAEAFALYRRLIALSDIPEPDRQRVAKNRDFSVPTMLANASSYPVALIDTVAAGAPDAEVTVSLVAGPDRTELKSTLNSFLHCCLDAARIGRFLVLDTGLAEHDRRTVQESYPFVEIVDAAAGGAAVNQLRQLRARVPGRFWLHLGQGWQFFAPENLIGRMIAVLDAEPQVFQVGVNVGGALALTGSCAAEQTVRRTPSAGRYLFSGAATTGPAMFDTARLDRAGSVVAPASELGRELREAGLKTATFDEVLCLRQADTV